jgi:ribonuclease Y
VTDTLVIVLIAAVLLLVVLVIVQGRKRSAAPRVPLDDSQLRRVLDQALAARPTNPAHAPVAGESADGTARNAAHEAAMAAASARIEQAERDAEAARADASAARAEAGRARADAQGLEADARRSAEKITQAAQTAARMEADTEVADAREEIGRHRSALSADRDRMVAEAAATLESERAELQSAQQRLQAGMDALTEDRRRLTADRERVRSEESEIGRSWAKVAGREEALRLEAEQVSDLQDQLTERGRELDERVGAIETDLVRISGLTAESARTELLARQEEVIRRDAAMMVRRIESEAENTAKQRARAIVADAIQRVASDQTAQTVVSVVQLPADDVKGRIIGREGRNIRTFETVTGVNVIIDDTPEAVLLSCFDPVRREIGRVTLEALIEDGRIHPHRIEEAFERAQDEVDARCARAAEDAMLDVGISDLHPELVTLIGHLKYRTSYGQNVLGHLVETAHIAGAMAAELGIDPKVVVRGAFLHDIGKALTHEALGSHATVGAELARRYGESEDVAHCIEAHHDEVAPATVEAVLTQAADACSGGRPGARRESLESYVQRLERIEAIAAGKKGVEKVFAMQAGRELRVMVKPEVVDDLEAHLLAREVAKQIEEELTYPGQVRVTVIRESRATEVAR